MVFEPEPYSVLIVSPGDRFRESLSPLLPPGSFNPVCVARSCAEARRKLLERGFDLVLINSPLPDGPGLPLAEDLCAETEAGVLLLVPAGIYEETAAQAQQSGVITLHKPSSRLLASHSLQALCAMRERLRARGRTQVAVDEKIRELQMIDRAKWVLIDKKGFTEPEAHRALERMAMEQRITKVQAAQRVVGGISI